MLDQVVKEWGIDSEAASLGPREPARSGSEFAQYDQYDLGIKFVLAMLRAAPIAENRGGGAYAPAWVASVCVPTWRLCAYGDASRDLSLGAPRGDACPPSLRDAGPLYLDVRAGLYATHLTVGTPTLVVPPDAERRLEEDCDTPASSLPRVAIANFGLYETGDMRFGHANGLVFNARTRTIERYEPQGYGGEERDAKLERLFRDAFPTWSYASVASSLGGGPQDVADAYGGLCETYATLFVLVRLQNLSASPAEVFAALAEAPAEELLSAALALNRKMARTLRRTRKGALQNVAPTRRAWHASVAARIFAARRVDLTDAVRVYDPSARDADRRGRPSGSELVASAREVVDATPTHAIRRALRAAAREAGSSLRRVLDYEVRAAPTRKLARYARDALKRVIV